MLKLAKEPQNVSDRAQPPADCGRKRV